MALGKVRWPGGQRVQLLHGTGRHAEVIAPDYLVSAEITADYIRGKSSRKIALVLPFEGDPAIDEAVIALRRTLAPFSPIQVPYSVIGGDSGAFQKLAESTDFLICPEDNIASVLAERLKLIPNARRATLFGTQGTGVLHSPSVRLRLDYRRLGRASTSRILHSGTFRPTRAALIDPNAE